MLAVCAWQAEFNPQTPQWKESQLQKAGLELAHVHHSRKKNNFLKSGLSDLGM